MSDLIDRQIAISAICSACGKIDCDKMDKCEKLQLPPANNSEIPNSSDTISRAKAIEAIEKCHKKCCREDATGDEWIHYETILNEVESIPPAQPERIKGHWIEIALSNHTYKCSVCGRLLVNITDGKNNVAKNYPYCHCGADMRGEQDE